MHTRSISGKPFCTSGCFFLSLQQVSAGKRVCGSAFNELSALSAWKEPNLHVDETLALFTLVLSFLLLSAVCCLCHTYVPVHQTLSRISKLDIWPRLTYLKWQHGLKATRLNPALTSPPAAVPRATGYASVAAALPERHWQPQTASSSWLVLYHQPAIISYWTLTSKWRCGPLVTGSPVCSVKRHAFPLWGRRLSHGCGFRAGT